MTMSHCYSLDRSKYRSILQLRIRFLEEDDLGKIPSCVHSITFSSLIWLLSFRLAGVPWPVVLLRDL